MTSKENKSANELLDALYLNMFHLIEAHTQSRVNIERAHSSGAILLARTKYQQGGSKITTAQIPTEYSSEFNAICRVVKSNDQGDTTTTGHKEVCIERHAVDKANGYVEPLHWFSVLPSMSLRNAVTKFQNCIELVVESTNLQRELDSVLSSISKLKHCLAH